MSQNRKSFKIIRFFIGFILYLFLGQLVYAGIFIDPINIELGRGEDKTKVTLFNDSSDDYIYRSGVIRSKINGSYDKESKSYLIYPPVGLLKSNSEIELGVVKMKTLPPTKDEKIYLYVQLIPKEKEIESNKLVIPLKTTILVEINRKE